MINLRNAKRIVIIGGGIAGWFSALTFRRIAAPEVEVLLLEEGADDNKNAIKGGFSNLVFGLQKNGINIEEFINATKATVKFGSSFEGWRNGSFNDIYFHLFHSLNGGSEELEGKTNRTYPLLAGRIAAGLDMFSYFAGFSLINNNATQAQAHIALASNRTGLWPSFHFDENKMADFLKTVAKARGIKHKNLKVEKLILDKDGKTTALKTPEGNLDVDFVIDASGLRRIGIGETYKQKWQSFSKELILDRILPFTIKQPNANPALYTRSIAMQAGWMWQIPLNDKIGAGYVFSSKHSDELAAIKEVEAYIGHAIEPQAVMQFDPGHYENVWCKNVLAVGLSSGFIEPLEATSIGHMLKVLERFENIVNDGHGIIGENTIDTFNQDNQAGWGEMKDFLRLHYDTSREDTPFWQDAKNAKRSTEYQDLCEVLKTRMPRFVDLEAYADFAWQPMFNTTSWIMVGAALGVIPQQAAYDELATLPKPIFDEVQQYLMRQKQLLSQ
ncbi:tryptophan 7-halogenase [Bartonella sp. HY761]|uniref:tryptophan 7-halogenase n=1 Tax=Bartonella sp. HY761 TaxID=2979330 RepID=UPI0022043B60|nr:tryptophan 7-halogenase [Bartonella sp. HY761]UXN06723.1 tryptophan 7-halogenase [Bartonella sp. HY761]